jgi:hypothetical protein
VMTEVAHQMSAQRRPDEPSAARYHDFHKQPPISNVTARGENGEARSLRIFSG